jgi:hypothetical protein
VETAWTPEGYSMFLMLGPGADVPRVTDDQVKSTLLAALSPSDRRSICGGMDATAFLRPDSGGGLGSQGRESARFGVRDDGAGRLISTGWPSFVEYDMGGSDPARAKSLRLSLDRSPAGLVEVWWRGDRERWSETRSIRLRPHRVGVWLLPLDRLPHWDPSDARRVRLLFHSPGPVSTEAPGFLP